MVPEHHTTTNGYALLETFPANVEVATNRAGLLTVSAMCIIICDISSVCKFLIPIIGCTVGEAYIQLSVTYLLHITGGYSSCLHLLPIICICR